MYAIWLLTLILFLPSASMAGEKGKLVSLLADYADLKQRVDDMRETRKSGYAPDTKDLINLLKDIQEASFQVMKFRNSEFKPGATDKTQEVTTSMSYAYNAMSQIVQAELDRYLRSSNVGMQLTEKYEAIWKIVDPSIPAVSSPQPDRTEAPGISSSHTSSPPLIKPVSVGQLKLLNVVTSISRYGLLFANFSVENASDQDMKDFTVSCVSFAPSGTELGQASKTLYEIIGAKTTQEYEGIEIGPAHKQTFRVRCQIVNAAPMR